MNKIPSNIYFFMGFVALFPLIDILNGFFLTAGIALPMGVPYRFFFFIFLILMILLGEIPRSNYTFITLVFIIGNSLIFILQSIFLQVPLSGIIEDSSVFIKYFLWVLIPYYIYQRKHFFLMINFEKLFIFLNYCFVLGLLIPYFLGLGRHTYAASSAGYKGYFIAQNDISCAYIILITFSGWRMVKKVKGKWNFEMLRSLLLFVGTFLCLFLIGMKTGVFIGILIAIYVFVSLLFSQQYRSVINRIIIWMVSSITIFWIFFRGIGYAMQLVSGTYERMIYFYHLYDGDFVRLLSSSRSVFLEGGKEAFFSDQNLMFTLFFGQGFSYRVAHFGRLGLIEMDFFDIFFGLGIVGTMLFMMIMGYFFIISMQKGLRSIYSLIFIIALFYSFFAGHVFFSALASTFFGLICGAIILVKKE